MDAVDSLKQELNKVKTRAHALEQAIALLEGHSILVAPSDAELPKLDFKGLGIVDAAKRFLAEMGEPQTTKAITETLLARGMETSSKNYLPTVYSTLDNSKEFQRVGGAGRKGKWAIKEKRG